MEMPQLIVLNLILLMLVLVIKFDAQARAAGDVQRGEASYYARQSGW